ncbi:endoribonuclease L-PSP [Arenicella xantha]|uniref:Endoribonuclease L-PSP n=2 Tax=Arenicella xantha TaxID=644221 RepID=A0A395JH55_9GAMM|nr:RidA family protein [Arenicella xantha]RBP44833.1 endoribonuclease L-PSP [Arenicella xantha]
MSINGVRMIERVQGAYAGRNKSSAYKDLIWTVATSSDTSLDLEGQTKLTLETIAKNLEELGSNKFRILSAQVYIANMQHKPIMDNVWKKWLGENPQNWPQRACLGVQLEGSVLIEITVVAARV